LPNQTTLEEGVNKKTIFMEWWNSEVIKTDPEMCSDSLLFYPGTLATQNYRNVYLEPPVIPAGWGIYSEVIFAGVSDVVLPSTFSFQSQLGRRADEKCLVRQVPYNSTITLHEEVLPIAVDIIAAPGCDAVIFELAVQLEKAVL
jgi:hypothetical protein